MDETGKVSGNTKSDTGDNSERLIKDLSLFRENLKKLAENLKLTPQTSDSNMLLEDDEILEDNYEDMRMDFGSYQRLSRIRKADDEICDGFSLDANTDPLDLNYGDLQKQKCENSSMNFKKLRFSNVDFRTGKSSSLMDCNNKNNAERFCFDTISAEVSNANSHNSDTKWNQAAMDYYQGIKSYKNENESPGFDSKILSSYLETLKNDLAPPISIVDKLSDISINHPTNSDGQILVSNSEPSTNTSNFLQRNPNMSSSDFTAQEVQDNPYVTSKYSKAQETVVDHTLQGGNTDLRNDFNSLDNNLESRSSVLSFTKSESEIGHSVSKFPHKDQEPKQSDMMFDVSPLLIRDGNLINSTADIEDISQESNILESFSHIQPSLVDNDSSFYSSAIATRLSDSSITPKQRYEFWKGIISEFMGTEVLNSSEVMDTLKAVATSDCSSKLNNSYSTTYADKLRMLNDRVQARAHILSKNSKRQETVADYGWSESDQNIKFSNHNLDSLKALPDFSVREMDRYQNIPIRVSNDSNCADDFDLLEARVAVILTETKDSDIADVYFRLKFFLDTFDEKTALQEFIESFESKQREDEPVEPNSYLEQKIKNLIEKNKSRKIGSSLSVFDQTIDRIIMLHGEKDSSNVSSGYSEDKGIGIGYVKPTIRDRAICIGNVESTNRDRGICIDNVESTNRDRGICIGNVEPTIRDREICIGNVESTNRDRGIRIFNVETKNSERTSINSDENSDSDSDDLDDLFITVIKCHPIKKFEIPPYASPNDGGILGTTGVKPDYSFTKHAWIDTQRDDLQHWNILEGCTSDLDSDSIMAFDVTDCFSQNSEIICNILMREYMKLSAKVNLLLIKPVKNISAEEYELRMSSVRALDDEVGYFYGKIIVTINDWLKQFHELELKKEESSITSRELHHLGILRISVKLVGLLHKFTLRKMVLKLEHFENALVYHHQRGS